MTQTCCCLIKFEWQNNLGLYDLLVEFYVTVLSAVLSKMELGIYPSRETDSWNYIAMKKCFTAVAYNSSRPFCNRILHGYCVRMKGANLYAFSV